MKYGVMSYNMSFASDQGKAIGSEKHFIKQGGNWDNALGMVKKFFNNESLHPVAIGLQEINDADFLKATGETKFNGGTDKLAAFVGGEIKRSPFTAGEGVEPKTKAEVVGDEFQHSGYAEGKKLALAFWGPTHAVSFSPKALRPVLAIIWDRHKLGDKFGDYAADIGTDHIFKGANKRQQGRPIYIVKTVGGFMLVALHGPNYADESLIGMPLLRKSIDYHIKAAEKALGRSKKIFIMGDFNDPHFGINDSKPIGMFKMGRTVEKKADVLSCCYNFNSSCPTGLYNATNETVEGTVDKVLQNVPEDKKKLIETTYIRDGTVKIKALPFECFIDVSPQIDKIWPDNNEEVFNPRAREMTPEGRGDLGNYKFTGDYVMSNMKVDVPLTLLRKTLGLYKANEPSKESDHEPVYAVFHDTASGGRRTRTRKHKNNGRKHQTRRR